jgi:uncharacterized protein (TIGR02099 family)
LFEYRIFSVSRQNVTFPGSPRWLQISSLWTYRVLTWTVLGSGFVFAVLVLSLRYWVLPNIEQYREPIAQAVSRAANQHVSIGGISANWDGMRPELVLENVTVFDREGRPALELSRVDNVLSWMSLAALELRFQELEIHRPVLDIRRDARGVISIAGIELTGKRDGGGFADWLLRQRQIVVRDAVVFWRDELRGAPPLELRDVNVQINNRGDRHRFGLRAAAPEELAGGLDVRGDLTGETVAALADWNGRLFLQLDHADIAAWRAWLAFPVDVPQGSGALRSWLRFSDNRLTDIIADVRLANVRARLAQDLPELDLTELSGRVAWKATATGFEFSTTRLGLTTQGGLTLHPADFLLRLSAGKHGTPARGELYANALDLEPLVLLADRLPLDAEFRKRLVELSPKGGLFDVVMRWGGDWRAPAQYSARGRFQNLALGRVGEFPGVSGLSGSIEGNERTGSLYLNSAEARFDMPRVFHEPLSFATLVAQLGWARSGSDVELRLNNVSFSNPHFAGSMAGSYRTAPSGPGMIDLSGALTRADASHAARYVPLAVDKATREWLDASILAGQSRDVSLRLKGDLRNFPFPQGKGGIFRVAASVTGGVIDYANGWPRIENLAGDLTFSGERMEVNAREGTILGVQLGKVRAEIPDLKDSHEILRVSGEAEGPTSDFLSFIEKSPVRGMIEGFTDGMGAQGNGRLALKLELPLRAIETSEVAGSYQFLNNQIVFDADLPPLEQANGRLEFTESSVRVPHGSGVFLGGPLTLAVAPQPDATARITLQGRSTVDSLRRVAGDPWWAQSLIGAADWQGVLVLRGKVADLVVESSLQGVASSLPAPLTKAAAESVPVRYERRFAGRQEEHVSFSYGDLVRAKLVRGIDGGHSVVRRGTIHFGADAVEPERDGLWLSGALKHLDLDRWLALAKQGSGQPLPDLAGIDMRFGEIVALNRTFHAVTVAGTVRNGAWRSAVSAREFEGIADWHPQGRGKLTARLARLTVPPSMAPPYVQEGATAQRRELPAVDLVAEQFHFGDKSLGRLELLAVPEAHDWHIQKLHLANEESTLAAEGLLEGAVTPPRTRINLRLDVNDIGRLLSRLGYPEGVRRGTAKLEGALTWAGGPQDFDYPQLSGSLVLNAAKGQFLKLEPGIGKLLGILSLQALPRRITLDFRDVFSDGFAFDQISGPVTIERGVAATDNFRIQGPAARVVMKGEVDLVRETQQLHMRITPSLSDSVAIAGALLGGPVAGVAAYLAQKVLKEPLEQITSYEYKVTGTWSEPQVSKVGRLAPPDAENPQ